jgi:hypothetical protein
VGAEDPERSLPRHVLAVHPIPERFGAPKIQALFTVGVLEVIAPAAAKALEPPRPKSIPFKTIRPVTQAKEVA